MDVSQLAVTFRPLVLRFSPRGSESVAWDEVATADDLVVSAQLRQGGVAVLVVDQSLDPQLGYLTQWSSLAPSTIRILLSTDPDFHILQQAVNRGRLFRVARDEDELRELIEIGLQEFHQELQRVELVRESARQNRELEELTLNLESRVEERTLGIQQSKEQEEDKLNRIRRLVKFIKQLTQVSSVEELLLTLRNDLRPFHHVVSPLLLFPMNGKEQHIAFFSKTRIQFKSLSDGIRSLREGEESLPNLLANLHMRPVAKLLRFEIELGQGTALLIIEHTGNHRELKSLESHLFERRRPIGMTLDRLLLEMENNFSSFRWEKTFDNLKSPISIIDLQMGVVRSNRGFSRQGKRGQCYRLFADREEICPGCPVALVQKEGQAHIGLVQVDGTTYQVHSYPIHMQEGGPITNVVNLYVDITPQRELQRRLLQNEKMSAVGLLAGNIAHELNNPLTGLRSLAQVLALQVPPDSTMASDLKEIEKASARCQTIIRNLLDFTIPGVQPRQATTLDEIVQKTLPFLKSMLRMHRLDLRLDAGSAVISVEPNLIQQVVFNLINNACQAMKKSGTLLLETRVVESAGAEGQFVELTIGDTGEGIPMEIRERIFEPFFTTKVEGSGTGLGLSLSKEIVEKFGGRLRFESTEGEGTQFFVSLPLIANQGNV